MDNLSVALDAIPTQYQIDPERLKFAFQPIWDVRNNQIYGYECLMRPNGELPMPYIKAYAEAGCLDEIEELTVLYGTAAFCRAKLPGRLFLNSFPSICMSAKATQEAKKLYREKMKDRLVVEILEYTKYNPVTWALKKQALEQAGIHAKYALDDFGTGQHVDVQCIRRYEPDLVKLDRKYVSNIDQKPDFQRFVRTMIEKGHADGREILAEGVETEAEYKFFQPLVDYMQGYYLGRPEILE